MGSEPIQKLPDELERQARDLYRRYGALPCPQLPEATREHFRGLVRAGLDGEERPPAN